MRIHPLCFSSIATLVTMIVVNASCDRRKPDATDMVNIIESKESVNKSNLDEISSRSLYTKKMSKRKKMNKCTKTIDRICSFLVSSLTRSSRIMNFKNRKKKPTIPYELINAITPAHSSQSNATYGEQDHDHFSLNYISSYLKQNISTSHHLTRSIKYKHKNSSTKLKRTRNQTRQQLSKKIKCSERFVGIYAETVTPSIDIMTSTRTFKTICSMHHVYPRLSDQRSSSPLRRQTFHPRVFLSVVNNVNINNMTSAKRRTSCVKKLVESNSKLSDQSSGKEKSNKALLRGELIRLFRRKSKKLQNKPNATQEKLKYSKCKHRINNTPINKGVSMKHMSSTLDPAFITIFLYSAENSEKTFADDLNNTIYDDYYDVNQPERIAQPHHTYLGRNTDGNEFSNDSMYMKTLKLNYVGNSVRRNYIKNKTLPTCTTIKRARRKIRNNSTMQIRFQNKTRLSNLNRTIKSKRKAVKNETTKVLAKSTTYFNLYDYFLSTNDNIVKYNKSLPNINSTEIKCKTSKLKLCKKIYWKQFLWSAENTITGKDLNVGIKVLSDSKSQDIDYADNKDVSSEQKSRLLMSIDLYNSSECERIWNQTIPPRRKSGIPTTELPYQKITLSAMEVMEARNIILQNYSREDPLKDVLTVHPLYNPFTFDESVLPNTNESKLILSKLFNQTIKKLNKFLPTKITHDPYAEVILKNLRKKFSWDSSLSLELKILLEQGKLLSTKTYEMTLKTDALSLTSEKIINDSDGESILCKLLRGYKHSIEIPKMSTLSLQESKLLFLDLGFKLLGKKIRIDKNYYKKMKKRKVHSKVTKMMHNSKKNEELVWKMVTEDSTPFYAHAPWLGDDSSGDLVNINFNMIQFLSRLSVYLAKSRPNNDICESSLKPGRSFLVGKPFYWKKRKNVLV